MRRTKGFTYLYYYPVLGAPGFSQQFTVAVYAGDVGIGAVLMQEHNMTYRIGPFFSKTSKNLKGSSQPYKSSVWVWP